MENIGIIGLGLIGGSIAKAALAKGYKCKIIAFDKNLKSLEEAFSDKTINDYSTESLSVLSNCDVIFICTPIHTIPNYIKKLLPIVKESCILTDVGSTKNDIMEQIEKLNICNFIGGHPMAGSEKIGYSASKEFLFENAYYILTPSKSTAPHYIQKLSDFAQSLGAMPIIMDSHEHDYAVAAISHMPHVVASALVASVKNSDKKGMLHMLAAGGFKDITRIASSSPEIWCSICKSNKEHILTMLSSFKNELQNFENILIDDSKIYNFFNNAKSYRDSFSAKSSSLTSYMLYEIKMDVPDELGIIAKIATILSQNDINIKNIGIVNSREYENGVLQVVFENKEDLNRSVSLLKAMNYVIYE